MVLCCERKLENGKPADCVCGCDGKTSSFFKSGCDGPFYSNLEKNPKALNISRVLWCSLPLCSNNGVFADEIKAYREMTGCTDTSEIVSKRDIPCLYA